MNGPVHTKAARTESTAALTPVPTAREALLRIFGPHPIDTLAARQLGELLSAYVDSTPTATAAPSRAPSTTSIGRRFETVVELLESGLELYERGEDAEYLRLEPLPQHVPAEWIAALDRMRAKEDPDFVMPWDDESGPR